MTTMLLLIRLGGKGGIRNQKFVETFQELLPRATEEILQTVREVVMTEVPAELSKNLPEQGTIRPEPFPNEARIATQAFRMPSNQYDYLAVKSSFFQEKVCSWIGDVADCYVGRSSAGCGIFKPIKSTDNIEPEESSAEED